MGRVSDAKLDAVRFRGSLLPSAATSNISRFVDHASVLPLMRAVNATRLPSGLKLNSSSPPHGFDGTSASSVRLRSTGTPATVVAGEIGRLKRCDWRPSTQ